MQSKNDQMRRVSYRGQIKSDKSGKTSSSTKNYFKKINYKKEKENEKFELLKSFAEF
jgi:hypothetical protein